MSLPLSIDTNTQIVLNGVELVNRDQLSPSQDRALQQFIDANSHLLQYADRPPIAPQSSPGKKSPSNYNSLRQRLGAGSPRTADTGGYNTIDKYFRPDSSASNPSYQERNLSVDSSPLHRFSSLQNSPRDRTSNFDPDRYSKSLNRVHSPHSDIVNGKRKEVSWYDGVSSGNARARSHSPTSALRPLEMSQYGSTGNLSYAGAGHGFNRDQTTSPAYSTLEKHKDDYNRYDTARHAHRLEMERRMKEDDQGRFHGYGDRPGAGVEMAPSRWRGGEVIMDRTHLPKGIQPRRIYYSPIGDGVVAADGVEMKRVPVEQGPRISVTQQRMVERGSPGHAGHRVYEKTWTSSGDGDYGLGAGQGAGSGAGSGAQSPFRSASAGPHGGAPGAGYGDAGHGGAGGPGGPGGLGGPGGVAGHGVPSSGLGPHDGRGGSAGPYASNGQDPYGSRGSHDPYGTLGSSRSEPFGDGGRANGLGTGGSDFGGSEGPRSGRTSAASGIYGPDSDRRTRYEIKTDYMITNPRELIHQYATTTPVAVFDLQDRSSSSTRTVKTTYTTTQEDGSYSPYPPYHGRAGSKTPTQFVRQIRDEGLTTSQKEANQRSAPLNETSSSDTQKVERIRQQTARLGGNVDIDALTEKMMFGLQTGHPTPPAF
ncbi:hypothetical protein QR680_001935 [Steinernema hermaphroditum]|uniref:Uncharacterized protein n=1 Tax=Steinernema hermaphroditum TaxID=289476 RepID=A0AA39LGL9_9BILA|nr:hypothetical protein QR680_001935 [Steinernema hermaphroditum]